MLSVSSPQREAQNKLAEVEERCAAAQSQLDLKQLLPKLTKRRERSDKGAKLVPV